MVGFWLLARSVLCFEPQDPLSETSSFSVNSLHLVELFCFHFAWQHRLKVNTLHSVPTFHLVFLSVFDAFSNFFADTFHKAEVVNAKWRHKTRLINSMKTAITYSLSLWTNQTSFWKNLNFSFVNTKDLLLDFSSEAIRIPRCGTIACLSVVESLYL